jgi:hypothetical protein
MRLVRFAQKYSGFSFGRAYAGAAPYAQATDGTLMKRILQSCLALFIAALLALAPVAPAWADDGGDGGGDDGGDFDDGGDDADDNDNDEDKDGDGRPDKDGHKDGHGHHGRHHHPHHIHSYGGWPGWGFGPGFGFGAFGYMPPYYPPAYYGNPPVGRFVPPAVYIERKDLPPPATTQSQGNFWHYCRSAEGYYPQVKECPDGWEQVAPEAKQDDQE